MNSNSDSNNLTDFSEEAETISIDEFFRQLEAKERDLDISSELVIEIEDSDEDDDQTARDISRNDAPSAEIEFESPFFAATSNKTPPSLAELENLRNKVLTLQAQIIGAENERVEMIENARRRFNDFENYKTRTERERSETFRNQLSNLAVQMLPVLDNMNRALDSTKSISNQKTSEFQQFFEGIELVSQQLNEILAEMGVQPIVAVGERFDPHLHEAVATEIDDTVAANTVVEELLRGYRIGEKIIRPSMVKVSVSSAAVKLPGAMTFPANNFTDEQ